MDALLWHDWPGNVRELRNVIERVAILCEEASIRPEDLAVSTLSSTKVDSTDLEDVEKRTIERVMRETHGNKSAGVPTPRDLTDAALRPAAEIRASRTAWDASMRRTVATR